jgi:hypothetical protein
LFAVLTLFWLVEKGAKSAAIALEAVKIPDTDSEADLKIVRSDGDKNDDMCAICNDGGDLLVWIARPLLIGPVAWCRDMCCFTLVTQVCDKCVHAYHNSCLRDAIKPKFKKNLKKIETDEDAPLLCPVRILFSLALFFSFSLGLLFGSLVVLWIL